MQFLQTLTDIATPTDIAAVMEENMEIIKDLPESAEEVSSYVKNLWTMLEEFAVTYGGKLIIALILIIIGFKLVNRLTRRIGRAKAFDRFEPSVKGFGQSLLSIACKVLIGMTALNIMGIPMTSMVAVIGSCGLAVGLALQGSLSNIAGGFIILFCRPFSAGDFISSGDISGTVDDIGIFHTRLITVDNRKIIVPNSTISNATITNFSAMKTRRVDLTFTAAYDCDIDKVEKTLLAVCAAHEKVLKDPAPFARLCAHRDSALEYQVRAWCENADYWDVYFDLIKNTKIAFDKEGIVIPFPQVDIHNK